jgi:hypothetical protein
MSNSGSFSEIVGKKFNASAPQVEPLDKCPICAHIISREDFDLFSSNLYLVGSCKDAVSNAGRLIGGSHDAIIFTRAEPMGLPGPIVGPSLYGDGLGVQDQAEGDPHV